MLKTLRGWVRRDGRLDLLEGQGPDHDAPVLVTFLEDAWEREDQDLADIGDYQQTLTDYEDRLARGEVRWT